jgi:hypothetical protein
LESKKSYSSDICKPIQLRQGWFQRQCTNIGEQNFEFD